MVLQVEEAFLTFVEAHRVETVGRRSSRTLNFMVGRAPWREGRF
jgi:hypothetical protein